MSRPGFRSDIIPDETTAWTPPCKTGDFASALHAVILKRGKLKTQPADRIDPIGWTLNVSNGHTWKMLPSKWG